MVFIVSFLVIVCCILIYEIHRENKKLTVAEYTLYSEKLPVSFDDINIVMLSDLHNNIFGNQNEILINTIEKQNPDYILIGGDMIVGKEGAEYTDTLSLISKLAGNYPVYYAMGNHEQKLKMNNSTSEEFVNNYVNQLEKCGVCFLNNDSAVVERNGESLFLTGLEMDMHFYKKGARFPMPENYLEQAVGKKHKEYTILLAHNPIYFKEYADWGADLVLSGHVHGGIIRLPILGGVLSTQLTLFPKYDYGKFKEKGSVMLLTSGLGMHTIKVRLFNPPEILVVHLKQQST